MIEPSWRRIGAFHLESDGTLGAVWLAHDFASNVVYCYDAAIFRPEVPAVINEAIAARGRHIPLAWRKKDKELADRLLESGMNVLPDHSTDDPGMIEMISREIWQKMRTSQFRVDERVGEWLKEYRMFYKDGFNVPDKGFPLMSATRHAVEKLDWAEAELSPHRTMNNFPKMNIV